MSTMNNVNEQVVQAAAIGVNGLAGFNGGTSILRSSWLSSQNELEQLHELRMMALGNAKMIYGSEKFKFYDVAVAYSESDAKFAAILVCIFNEATKILRKEVAGCPLAAARATVQGLHNNTGLLLSKYNVGDQLFGQQGGTPCGGIFDLFEWKRAVNDLSHYQDDTSSLVRDSFPTTGPRIERDSSKRLRQETDRRDHWDRSFDSPELEGRLRYDD